MANDHSTEMQMHNKRMAAIRGKDTGPELYLRRMLFSAGYRYRIYDPRLPGHPDLWLKKYNTAIYVHGCFWHRHDGCKYSQTPRSRIDFWETKFRKNMARDVEIKESLASKGIRCLIVWECSIRNAQKKTGHPEDLLLRIEGFLHSTIYYEEI